MKVALFGASGFVGRAALVHLVAQGHDVVPFVRTGQGLAGERVVGPLEALTDCQALLEGVDVVVNLAARVHMMVDDALDPLEEYRRINSAAAVMLARSARDVGVRRYVYLSSVMVNGDNTNGRAPFTADEVPTPVSPYGQSKLEAERALLEIAALGGMDTVIIRPPLVYGPGVKANFEAMMRWLRRGVPLPLAGFDNRRSLVGLENLVDLIALCLTHKGASNQILMVSDGRDVSTPQLLKLLAEALGTRARLFPAPFALLRGAARLVGREAALTRLAGNLQIDIGKTTSLLGWRPPVTIEQGFEKAARSYLGSRP